MYQYPPGQYIMYWYNLGASYYAVTSRERNNTTRHSGFGFMLLRTISQRKRSNQSLTHQKQPTMRLNTAVVISPTPPGSTSLLNRRWKAMAYAGR